VKLRKEYKNRIRNLTAFVFGVHARKKFLFFSGEIDRKFTFLIGKCCGVGCKCKINVYKSTLANKFKL